MSEPTKVYEESPGVTSSKRVAGMSVMGVGVALLVAVGLIALFRESPMPNSHISIDAGKALIYTGAALLGITVFESFVK